MGFRQKIIDRAGDVWHRARWANSGRGLEGPMRSGLAPITIRSTGYRARHMLTGRWSLHAMGEIARYQLRALFDPELNAMRIAARGRGDWLRLLYDVSPEMHRGGAFTVSFDLSMPDGETRGLAWASTAWNDEAGALIIGQKFFTGMTEPGAKALRFDVPALAPGRPYYFVFCLTSFPSTVEISGVQVTEHVPDPAQPPPPPPPPPAPVEPNRATGMRKILTTLTPSAADAKFWSRDDGFRKLRDTFWEQYYVRKSGLAPDTSAADAFRHFLTEGLQAGVAPNPMFDEDYYVAEAGKRGLPPVEPDRSVYLHWLTLGAPARIVPTRLFNEEEYRFSSKVSVPEGLYFQHYLRLGFRRNFSPSQFFDGRWYAQFYKLPNDMPAMIDYALTGEKEGRSPHSWIAALPPGDGRSLALERLAERLLTRASRLDDPKLKAQVEKAAAIEPRIMRPLERRIITQAPIKHGASRLWAAGVTMREALAHTHYDTLVITPHCRMAGSARVAGALAAALQRVEPGARTLLVTTELSDFERPDWFPDAVEILNLPALLGPRWTNQVDMLLLDLAQGLSPNRIFNVNSPSGWKFLARFGRQLGPKIGLYSYLFTWEIDRLGVKCGYPIVELQHCIDMLDTCFVDNAELARETAWRYSMSPGEAEEKLAVLWSPTETSPVDLSANFERRRAAGEPLTCLWAGRFDRQKRLDIAVAAAEKRPDIAFTVYGKPVLADGATLPDAYPGNVTLSGVYGDLDEVGLDRHDLFFYTSAWDGVPTVLLDMGARGVPVLASTVGGVRDLIDEETGWPVADWRDPDAYLARIDEMVANPAEVTARARRLRERIAERHSQARFDRDLAAVLARRRVDLGDAA